MFNVDDLSQAIEGRFVIAAIIMIVIIVIMIILLFTVVRAFQHRRAAIEVELPDIDSSGEVISEGDKFQRDKEVTVELIPAEEDVVDDYIEKDESSFLEALSLETKQYVSADNEDTIDMPQIGEIDYEKLRLEREKDRIERLRELAEADNKEDLSGMDEVQID